MFEEKADPILAKLQEEFDNNRDISVNILDDELEFEKGVAIVNAEMMDENYEAYYPVCFAINEKGEQIIPLSFENENIKFENNFLTVTKRNLSICKHTCTEENRPTYEVYKIKNGKLDLGDDSISKF